MGDEKKPWEIGKSFDRSAPMGLLHRVSDVGHFAKGVDRQALAGIRAVPGLIYSGTPENVGPVVPGDVMQGSIAGLPTVDVRVV